MLCKAVRVNLDIRVLAEEAGVMAYEAGGLGTVQEVDQQQKFLQDEPGHGSIIAFTQPHTRSGVGALMVYL